MQDYLAKTSLAVRYLAQKNSGPAKARNVGLSLLSTPICLMLGDDIFASPTLVETHMKLHGEYPQIEVAALGQTKWATSGQKITRFMRWLGQSSVQFAYKDLLEGVQPDWVHFYTSNLSVKTELLKKFPFEEGFPYAAMEDSELGYRIKTQLRLDLKFLPEAVAHHLHPTTFRQACERMIRVGYSARVFHGLWPQQKPVQSHGLKQRAKQIIAGHPRLLKLLVDAGELCTLAVCPNPVMAWAFACNYEVGYQSSRNCEGKLVRN